MLTDISQGSTFAAFFRDGRQTKVWFDCLSNRYVYAACEKMLDGLLYESAHAIDAKDIHQARSPFRYVEVAAHIVNLGLDRASNAIRMDLAVH